jgi:Fe2+ or Zn2+ uptake regulation protein
VPRAPGGPSETVVSTTVVGNFGTTGTVRLVRSAPELRDHLRANGRRVTVQRELIAGLLRGNAAHPTAESLHAAAVAVMPSLSLKTVYLVLHELEELGEVRVITSAGGPSRFDPNTGDHQHLLCTGCGRLHDVILDRPVPSLPNGQFPGFDVSGADVLYRGTCPDCRAASAKPAPPVG